MTVPSSPASLSDTVVLLIEDDEDIRASMADCLQDEGFTVVSAAGVDEGLERLRRGATVATILLDLMMPVRSGWDFRKEQLADPALRDIPVVVVTASGISRETLRRDMGDDVELVSKPFTTESLLRAIARVRRLFGCKT